MSGGWLYTSRYIPKWSLWDKHDTYINILLTFLYTCILGHAARYPFSIIPKTSHTRRFAITFSGWECWYCWYCSCLAEHTTRQSQSWDDEKTLHAMGPMRYPLGVIEHPKTLPMGFQWDTSTKILGYELTRMLIIGCHVWLCHGCLVWLSHHPKMVNQSCQWSKNRFSAMFDYGRVIPNLHLRQKLCQLALWGGHFQWVGPKDCLKSLGMPGVASKCHRILASHVLHVSMYMYYIYIYTFIYIYTYI